MTELNHPLKNNIQETSNKFETSTHKQRFIPTQIKSKLGEKLTTEKKYKKNTGIQK